MNFENFAKERISNHNVFAAGMESGLPSDGEN